MTFIVAIDGGAGSGKGTIAKGISKKFNFSYFDTGIIYRGLALKTIRKYGEDYRVYLITVPSVLNSKIT